VKNSVRYKRRSKRSRGVKRRLAVLAALVAVAVAVWFALHPHATSTRTAAVATPIAPVPRATAAPEAWSTGQIAQLRNDLDARLSPALSSRYSLAVIDATGRVIYADRADDAVAPASVQKLIVADAALGMLGPDYRFHTVLAAADAPSNGTVDGDLWLVGSGDPSLRSNDLRSAATLLSRSGVHEIDGAVAVDASLMSPEEMNPHWDPQDNNEDYQVPTSAVSLDDDTAEFRVYGGTPGTAARVAVVPQSDDVHLSGQVTSSSGADSVVIAADAPNEFELSGYVPVDTEEKFRLPVHDMPAYVGSVFENILADAHIGTTHAPVVAKAPLDSVVLWDHRSAPLRSLLAHMLFVSDNHYAEQLMRTLGIDAGERGDDADGLAAEREFLRSRSIPTPGLRVVDGSGLAEANRVAAITLARILSDAELRGASSDLYRLLPSGGRDGTLSDYDFTSASGRVRAKTGHLSDADSLAGYITTKHHGRVAFAFMIDDSPGDADSAYVSAVDRIATF
jgi:serine-type D-Ala-D-Ala carboxypeptidase/endopeptidase (penicillin-binding protein 4)